MICKIFKKGRRPASHCLYDRYEYIAEIYAKKLWKSSTIGMDYEDVVQELRVKVFTAIKSYGKRWADFKRTGLYKPVPIRYYIQTVMNNKLIDMVEQIKSDINLNSLSIEDHNFDYGVNSSGYNVMNLSGKNKEVTIGGINLLQGLDGKQKDVFCMFLKGHPIKTIEKVFKGKVGMMLCPCIITPQGDADPNCKSCSGTRYIKEIGVMIRSQVEVLKEYKEEMIDGSQKVYYSYQMAEDE